MGSRDYRLRSLNLWLKKLLPGIQEGDLCCRALWVLDEPCNHYPIARLSQENLSENMKLYNQKLNRYLSIDSVLVPGK